VLTHLRGLALRVEPAVAHAARPTGEVEGHDHTVAGGHGVDLRADLLDVSHGLVAEDVAFVEEGAEHLVEMEVRTADSR